MAQEILVNIEVRTKEAQQQVKQLSKVSDELSQSFIVNNKYRKMSAQESAYLAGEEKKLAAEQKRLNAEMQNAGKIAKVYGTNIRSAGRSTSAASAAQKQFKTQAGLNNAILLEAGRLASDASFGFTAIANNLSQIVSLGSSFVATTGSFSSAMKELGRSLLGTGGFLIGVQLLISFMPKIIKFFTQSKDAVASETEELIKNNKELDKQIARRKILGQIAGESVDAFSADFARNIREGLNGLEATDLALEEIAERLDIAGVKNTKLIKDETIANEARLEIAFRLLDIFNEENKIKSLRKQQDEEILKAQEKNRDVNSLLIADLGQQIIRSRRNISGFNDEIARLSERGIVLTNKAEEDAAEFQLKIFEQKYDNFDKAEQRYRQNAQKAELRTNEEILAQTQQNEFAKIDIIEQGYVQREQLRLANYKKQLDEDVKNEKITRETADKLSRDADQKYLLYIEDLNSKRADLEEEVLNYISSLRTLQIRRDAERAQADFDKMMEIRRALSMDEANALKFSVGNNAAHYDEKGRLISQDIERQKRAIAFFKEGTLERAQAERELFNLQQSLRENDKQKELAYIDDKKSINLEYVGFAQGISQIFSTIAGENEGLQKAALVLEKGAAIADIVIKTQAANAATVAQDTATLGATIPITTPLRLRNNISAGISIANILATTLTSFKKPSASGGGGATATASVQAPAFNVVGASSTDQLAQAVSGQIQQPVRAFVVGAEITEQQALDRKIIETAGL